MCHVVLQVSKTPSAKLLLFSARQDSPKGRDGRIRPKERQQQDRSCDSQRPHRKGQRPKVLIRNLGKVIGYKVWARQRMKYYLAVNKE